MAFAVPQQRLTFLALGIAVLSLVGLVTLTVAVVSAWFLTESIFFNGAHLPPDNQSATPVGNGFVVPQQLWPPGFQSSAVSSVNVSYSVRDGYELEVNVSFYQEECSQVALDQTLLSPVQTTLLPPVYSRSPVNYLESDYPLYVSGGNSSLKYTVTASDTFNNESTGCALQLYLYDSSSSFSVFKDGLSPAAPYGEYIARSECLPVGRSDEPKTSIAIFNLSNESLYYVGAAVYANVDVSINISGMVLEYDVSKLRADECSLSPIVKSCMIQISSQARNVCVLYKSDNPFGTLTLYFDSQTTPWNRLSVTCLVVLLVSVVLIVFIVSFFVYCCWWMYKHTSHGYQEVTAPSEEACNKPDELVVT